MLQTIELARGLAALLVMACHYAPFMGNGAAIAKLGFVGVDWFFVLSGFVFAPSVLGDNRQKLVPYLIRRAGRIFPLFWMALLAYVLLSPPGEPILFPLLANIFLVHTWFDLATAFRFNSAFWSLPAEAQFYLLVPLWARLRFKSLCYGAVALVVFSLFLRMLITPMLGEFPPKVLLFPEHLWFNLPGQLFEFSVGVGAWYIWRTKASNIRFGMYACLVGVLLLFVLMAWFYVYGDVGLNASAVYKFLFSSVVPLAFGFFTLGGIVLIEPIKKLESFCLASGNLSYGIYLFHNLSPMLLLKMNIDLSNSFALLELIITTVIIAFVMHYLVERPARRWARRVSIPALGLP